MNHKSESGCKYVDKCHFRHTEVDSQPCKRSKKGGAKGSVTLLKETIQLGCMSHDCPQRQSIPREYGKLGSNHTVKFSKTTMRHAKNSGKKGPSQGIIQKCEPQERIPWAPKFEERTKNEFQRQERCSCGAVWNLAKDVKNLKKESKKDTFYSPAEVWVVPAPSPKNPEERQFVIDSRASMHMLSKKKLSSGELDTLKGSRTPHNSGDSEWRGQDE